MFRVRFFFNVEILKNLRMFHRLDSRHSLNVSPHFSPKVHIILLGACEMFRDLHPFGAKEKACFQDFT